MSFINNLQNQNISAEEKQAQATSYIQRLESEAGNIQVGTPEWNALPKYQQQRINNLRREINQVRETSWTTPEQYKASQPSTPSTNVYISNEGQFKPKETTETATEINLRTGERIQLRGTSQQIQAYTEYIRQQGQAEKQAKQVQAVKQQEQIKQSPFIEQYEYPFGREYQKVSVSELKKQQQIRVPEDYGFNIRQQLLSQGQQTQSSYLEISPNLFGVKPQPSRIESLQPFSGNQITKESEIYTPDLSQGGFNFFERMSKYGQAKVSEGDLLGYGALFTGTAIGTAYTMSPIGIGESLYKKGVLQTAEDYTIGTAKFFLNLPQNLKGTTPSQKATELLGFGVGGFLGGKVTKFTVEKPYQSL